LEIYLYNFPLVIWTSLHAPLSSAELTHTSYETKYFQLGTCSYTWLGYTD